jgi:outer membrane receptor protein involved in Fe transport
VGTVNPNGQRYFIPAGTRRARGVEFTGAFQVTHDLRLTGGASYIDAIYLGFPDGAAVSSSPIPNSRAEKTPRWSYNVYARYDRREGYLKGFGAGMGLAWQGSRLGSNGARTFAAPDPLVLPAFCRVDTAVFYRLNRHVEFAMNVDNIFDEVIFVNASVGSAIEIAAPRTLTFRTSINF